jgi:hypothetical protein
MRVESTLSGRRMSSEPDVKAKVKECPVTEDRGRVTDDQE